MTPDELAAAKAAYEAIDWTDHSAWDWASKYGDDLLAALSVRDAEIERLREAMETMLLYFEPSYQKGSPCAKCGKPVPFAGAMFCCEECSHSRVNPIAIAKAALAPAPSAAHGEAGTLTVDAAARRLMEAVRRYIDNPSDTQLRKDVLDADAAFRAAKNGGGE